MGRNKVLMSALAASSALTAAEAVLRLKDRANSRARFLRGRWTFERSWEQFDYHSGWELKPGYISGDIRINGDGFRGNELIRGDFKKIMCLGDSLTFGSAGENITYPHVLLSGLMKNSSEPIEVINAGVSGHTTYSMLLRLKRIMRYNPDMVVILAGWEDLFSEDITRYQDNRQPFSSYWHIDSRKNVRFHVWSLLRETMRAGNRKPFPLSYTPDEFVPFNFEYNLTKIIDRIQKYSARAVLVTLPKLIPDDPALIPAENRKKIVLPDFIDEGDFESFLKVYQSYDTIIRALASEKNVPLIDVKQMVEKLDTRDTLFEDTGGLSVEGYIALGRFIGIELKEKGLVE
ncbi:MAG: GDSL-type esterase/lipase family protein [Candidatus Latescibacterota bacterium]